MNMSKFATPADYWKDQAQKATDVADRALYALFQIKRFVDAGPLTRDFVVREYLSGSEALDDLELSPNPRKSAAHGGTKE